MINLRPNDELVIKEVGGGTDWAALIRATDQSAGDKIPVNFLKAYDDATDNLTIEGPQSGMVLRSIMRIRVSCVERRRFQIIYRRGGELPAETIFWDQESESGFELK